MNGRLAVFLTLVCCVLAGIMTLTIVQGPWDSTGISQVQEGVPVTPDFLVPAIQDELDQLPLEARTTPEMLRLYPMIRQKIICTRSQQHPFLIDMRTNSGVTDMSRHRWRDVLLL
jgi:hypothetical protein